MKIKEKNNKKKNDYMYIKNKVSANTDQFSVATLKPWLILSDRPEHKTSSSSYIKRQSV